MGRIVDKFLRELRDQLKEQKVTLEVTDAARELLAKRGYDPTFGARPLARVIDEEIKRPLTQELLFGGLEHGGTLEIDATAGELRLRVAE